MEWLIGGAFVAAVVALVIFIVVWCQRYVADRKAIFERLAAQYGGTCESPSWISGGTLQFPWKGTTLHLSTWSDGGGEGATVYTRIQAGFPEPTLQLEIERFDLVTSLAQSLGLTTSCPTGMKSFDELFRVLSNDCPRAQAYLTLPTMQTIEAIRALAPDDPMSVTISGGRMEINLGFELQEFDILARYLELATRLLEPVPLAK